MLNSDWSGGYIYSYFGSLITGSCQRTCSNRLSFRKLFEQQVSKCFCSVPHRQTMRCGVFFMYFILFFFTLIETGTQGWQISQSECSVLHCRNQQSHRSQSLTCTDARACCVRECVREREVNHRKVPLLLLLNTLHNVKHLPLISQRCN